MPLRRKFGYGLFATGLVVLLAGCGGEQNPWKVHTGVSNWFVNGIWDGLLAVPILVIKNWIQGGHHQLYTRNTYFWYYVVYIVVLFIVLAAILGFIRSLVFRRVFYRRRTRTIIR